MRPNQAVQGFHVQLFGGPKLFCGPVQTPITPLQRALIGLLFGGEAPSLPRERIVSLLWPAESPGRARARLSQVIYSLRERTGQPGIIVGNKDSVSPFIEGVSNDLTEYRDAIRSQRFHTCSSLLDEGFCIQALESVGRRFSDWVQAREAELRQELRREAERFWRACERDEAWEEACPAADALYGLAPTDESRLRQVMTTRAKAGLTDQARDAFKEFLHDREPTGLVVQEETRALYDLIKSGSYSALSVRESGKSTGLPEPPLLGRRGERSRVRKKLRIPPGRDLRVVLISGEAGIGKTRLIKEALSSPVVDGQRILRAGSAELEHLIPLNPLIELFRAGWAGEVLRGLEEPWRTVLFGVMPKHYLGEGPVPEAPHIQPGSVPRRLFEAFYQLLLAMVDDGPLIAVLEDIQWADETTLTVLEFLIRRWDRGELQLVVSARTEEVRRNPALGRFLEMLHSHKDYVEIPLKELEREDSDVLIQELAPEPLAKEDLSRLRSLAGGNPYFLIELTLEFLAGRLEPVEPPNDIVPIPLSIRQVLHRRLSQLSAEADMALSSLAVYSRPLQTSDIAQICQLPEPKCVSGLEQLEDFRLVSSQRGRARVSHELVRHTVYQDLPDSRRAWLHKQVALFLQRAKTPAPPDELAVHFDCAGSSAEALAYSSEAAEKAEASGAVPEALRFLRIAREHSNQPEEVARFIGKMGLLNYKHHNLEEATPLLEIASQRFRRQGKQEKALEAELARIDCLAQTGKHLAKDCLEELQLIKDAARSRGFWKVFQDTLDVEAHQLDRLGDLPGVRAVLREAEENLDRGTPEARCKARAMVALNIYFGSPEKGLRFARDSVAIALKTTNDDIILYSLNRLILVLHYQGLLKTIEGTDALAEAESRIGTCGDLLLKFHIQLNPAVWDLEIGELESARTALEALFGLVAGTRARDAQARLLLNLGELELASNQLREAEQAFKRAEELSSPHSPHFFQTLVAAGLGLCGLRSGNLAEARKRESDLPSLPDFWTFDPTLVVTFKARMLMKRRDPERALDLLGKVRERVRKRLIPAWLRLTLEEATIRRRLGLGSALSVTDEGLAVAKALGLERRTQHFEEFKKTL